MSANRCGQLAPAEEWRSIDGFPSYEVSNLGRVRSLVFRNRICCRPRKEPLVLRAAKTSTGYPGVGLCRDGRRHTKHVHALVAAAFLGARPTGMQVAHQDGSRDNNCVGNLAYTTPLENTRQKHQHGTVAVGERNGGGVKLTAERVREMRQRHAAGGTSYAQLGREYGVAQCTAARVVQGQNWKHVEAAS